MSRLKKHTPILPDLSEEVREFYENYPYPRPVENLDKYQQQWQDKQKRRADYHLFWPHNSYKENFSILIAGCGTSQAAKHALRWPNADVTGIDFSLKSVRCTEELKKKYNLKNLRIQQLPIERVEDLKRNFDQIVCTGVLHHLIDPDTGLKALRNVLKPDGAMHLMVYAPYGRTGIYLLQDFCRRLGIHANDADIQDLITTLKILPPGHPLGYLLREAPDFRQEAALADALLNPHDRAYSVPQLFDFLRTGGVRFGRWVKQAPYSFHCGVMARIPQSTRISELSHEEQYSAAELFRGTMVRHSLIAYRDDNTLQEHQVCFTGDKWPDYIPIKMSDTICVEERLPPGAAGVLINQTHTFKDLYMPVDSTEMLLFNAIDGNKSIGDILKLRMPSLEKDAQANLARIFFEKLWWYDQVVFGASVPT